MAGSQQDLFGNRKQPGPRSRRFDRDLGIRQVKLCTVSSLDQVRWWICCQIVLLLFLCFDFVLFFVFLIMLFTWTLLFGVVPQCGPSN